MNGRNDIEFLVLIADRRKKSDLLAALAENGGRVINSIYAKGSVKASSFMDALGFVPEENKIMITFLIARQKSDAILDMLVKKFNFDKPNTGIAFTIPVEGLLY